MATTPRDQMAEYLADLAEGEDVWCDFAERVARTADGHCQFCGKTDHELDADRQAALRDEVERREADRDAYEPRDTVWDEVTVADESEYI